eukprot:scaffold18684_cov121-Isochrysis_galbana.AAC.4
MSCCADFAACCRPRSPLVKVCVTSTSRGVVSAAAKAPASAPASTSERVWVGARAAELLLLKSKRSARCCAARGACGSCGDCIWLTNKTSRYGTAGTWRPAGPRTGCPERGSPPTTPPRCHAESTEVSPVPRPHLQSRLHAFASACTVPPRVGEKWSRPHLRRHRQPSRRRSGVKTTRSLGPSEATSIGSHRWPGTQLRQAPK